LAGVNDGVFAEATGGGDPVVLGVRAVDGEAGRVGVGPGVVETFGAGAAWVETAAWDADAVSLFVGRFRRCLV
jgi:hypothetical protein